MHGFVLYNLEIYTDARDTASIVDSRGRFFSLFLNSDWQPRFFLCVINFLVANNKYSFQNTR
jgi:hypothetical protein